MDAELKAKLVARLYALADGAEPLTDEGETTRGICHDIWMMNGDRPSRMSEALSKAIEDFTEQSNSRRLFPERDWGPDRRTLAGFLAAYIESEP